MTTIGDIGERRLIARIGDVVAKTGGAQSWVERGIGDDAAVFGCSGRVVASSDMLVEGVDFDFDWASFADVGHKAAAVNLSDLAAMGCRPRGLLLNLGLRRADAVAGVLALVRSLARVGAQYGAPLIGGDISSTSGPLVVSVTAVGDLDEGVESLSRATSVAGDKILVSGCLGGAAAGLGLMQSGHAGTGRGGFS